MGRVYVGLRKIVEGEEMADDGTPDARRVHILFDDLECLPVEADQDSEMPVSVTFSFRGCEGDTILELVKDLIAVQKLAAIKEDQFTRRTAVRTAFALIEAMSFQMRRGILLCMFLESRRTLKLDLHLLSLLAENTPTISSTGKITKRKQQQPMVPHIAFALRQAVELSGVDADQLFGDNGWNEFKKAIALRHRLTHPKSKDDLQVSDEDCEYVGKGLTWFWTTHGKAMRPIWTKLLQMDIAAFNELVDPLDKLWQEFSMTLHVAQCPE